MSVFMVAVAWMASHGSGPAWSATQSSNLSAHQCCRRHLRIPSLALWLGCATRGCAYPRNWVPYGRPRTVQHEIGTGSSHRRSAQSCVLVVPSGRVCSDSPLPRQSHPTNLVNPRPDKKNAHTAIPSSIAARPVLTKSPIRPFWNTDPVTEPGLYSPVRRARASTWFGSGMLTSNWLKLRSCNP